MHVELKSVGTDPYAQIERGERIFRAERGASPVREDERTPRVKEGHARLAFGRE